MLVDPNAPFFRPLWVRVLCVILPLIWAVVELRSGAVFWAILFGAAEPIEAVFPPHWGWLVAGGLFVGYGTRLGSGCTSGHGVCGMSRLSPRSLVATGVFMASGIATVALVNALGYGW